MIHWLDKWPETPFNGVIIANEVLDAMPVYRFMQSETEILESYVALDEHDQLAEIFKPVQNQRLLAISKIVYHHWIILTLLRLICFLMIGC